MQVHLWEVEDVEVKEQDWGLSRTIAGILGPRIVRLFDGVIDGNPNNADLNIA